MKNIYDSKKYFSPWVIICRGNKLNLDRDLNNIFYSFVKNYFNIYKSNPVNQFLNAEEIKINQIKYDKYSFEKDPADKLFKSFFGEKWTKKWKSVTVEEWKIAFVVGGALRTAVSRACLTCLVW